MKKLMVGLMAFSLLVSGCQTNTTTETNTTEPVQTEEASELPRVKEYDNTIEKKPVDHPGKETKIYGFYEDLIQAEQYTLKQGMHDPAMGLEQYNLMGRDGDRYINKMFQKSAAHYYEARTIWQPEGILVINDSEEIYRHMSKDEGPTVTDFKTIQDRIAESQFAIGEEEYLGETFYSETYYEGEMGTTYLWDGDELKHILVNTAMGDAHMSIDQLDFSIDQSLFDLPDHYQEHVEEE